MSSRLARPAGWPIHRFPHLLLFCFQWLPVSPANKFKYFSLALFSALHFSLLSLPLKTLEEEEEEEEGEEEGLL
jgi:hypothetical protein